MKQLDPNQRKKDALLESIFKQHPELESDTLKKYMVAQLVDSYLHDPDAFNKLTTEFEKKARKGDLPTHTPLPDEIQCVTCKPAVAS